MTLPKNGLRAAAANKQKVAVAAVPTATAGPQKTRKDLSASVLVSLGLHGLLLFVLSWIYFELPRPVLLESILTLGRRRPESRSGINRTGSRRNRSGDGACSSG